MEMEREREMVKYFFIVIMRVLCIDAVAGIHHASRCGHIENDVIFHRCFEWKNNAHNQYVKICELNDLFV